IYEETDILSEDCEYREKVSGGNHDAHFLLFVLQAWMNEKFAPELLESKTEIVECVMEQLEHMEDNLKRAKQGDLKISIHRMEVERIRYVLSSYLRCRLQKIEKYFPHVLEKEKTRSEGEPSILSPEEFAFAKEYMANTENHLKNVALRHMPPNLQKVEFLKAVPKPNLDAFVFLRVKERQENIMVEPEYEDRCQHIKYFYGFFRVAKRKGFSGRSIELKPTLLGVGRLPAKGQVLWQRRLTSCYNSIGFNFTRNPFKLNL
uniref:GINS complex subunit 4 n=1 Tax=Pseudonaja textilis TaxID=8673 RepID=A0A670Z4C6_PSETE